jgi:hypothetical protein
LKRLSCSDYLLSD